MTIAKIAAQQICHAKTLSKTDQTENLVRT